MKRTTPRRQRPVKGGRTPLPSSVEARIWKLVDQMALRYNVSRSFVIATALADQFGIKDVEHYYGDGKFGKTFAKPDLKMVKGA